MASQYLEPKQQNFVRLSLAGVDEARSLLGDVLRSQIPPEDIFMKIQTNTKLLLGSQHEKLSPEQLKQCYIPGPVFPDYQCFDVTLLYKLIRNLCSTLPISQGWGKKPNQTDIKIGDDVERLRSFRNEMIGHAKSSSVPDAVFDSMWRELENIFNRIQGFLASTRNPRGGILERLEFIRRTDFGWNDYTKSKNHLMFERMMLSDAPELSLKGDRRKACGESACFEIKFQDDQMAHNWPITWGRANGNKIEHLDISTERYRGSSSHQLVIARVSREDQGQYRATVSREEYGIYKEIPSNAIYLTVIGDSRPKASILKRFLAPFISIFYFFIRKERTDEKEAADRLKRLYSRKGSNVLFAKFSDDLAESFPESKLDRLKYVLIGLDVVDVESIQAMKSVREMFILLQKETLFTERDVIYMQYLLQKSECIELYDKCIQYAIKQRALCFYEKPPDNGFRHVKFHVAGDFTIYSKDHIQGIKETVVTMLGCDDGDVVIDGVCQAGSFFVVLAIKETILCKIVHLDQQQIDTLCDLKVDYFILDDEIYNIKSLLRAQYPTTRKVEDWKEESARFQLDTAQYQTARKADEREEESERFQFHTDYHRTKTKQDALETEEASRFLHAQYPITRNAEERKDESERFQLDKDYHRTKTKEDVLEKEDYRLLYDYHRTKTKQDVLETEEASRFLHAQYPTTRKAEERKDESERLQLDKDYHRTKPKEDVLEKEEDYRLLYDPPPSNIDKSPVAQLSSITIPGVDGVVTISVGRSGRLWVSDRHGRLLQVDSTGYVLHELKINTWLWDTERHTVKENGDLLFIDFDKVCNLTPDGVVTKLFTTHGAALCIYYSIINGHILVGSRMKVTRYGKTGRELKDIKNDDKGQSLYAWPCYIMENKNGDVWTSDEDRHAIVVVDRSGHHRFNYTGHTSDFSPLGMCTDVLGHVLVCDRSNHSVHQLDQHGQFLSLLLTRELHEIHHPTALCVDDQHNLYLGQKSSNTINVYKYPKDTDVK